MSKKIKNVTTIKGEELSIDKCWKFNNSWYKVGDINIENSGDCYCIDGRYYREETGSIVFDHELKQYSLKKDNIRHGVIDYKDKLIFGYFSSADNKNIEIISPAGNYYGLNDQIFNNTNIYRERLSDGKFYHISKLRALDFNKIEKPKQEYKHSLPYDSKDCLDKFIDSYKNLNIEVTNTNIERYSELIKGYTFGLEFETTKGVLPKRILNNTGLIPLRDGSISGIEYVTVPLEGAKGLQTIVNDCELLSKRTKFDHTCSMHLHIGGIPRTKEYILAFVKTMCYIQDEIFELFPLYKKYNFGIKNKNYSAPFNTIKLFSKMDPSINNTNINKNFDVLYRYLTGNLQSFEHLDNNLDNVKVHPADPQGNQKWLCKSRYKISNVDPIIFGNKKTIEFRIHTPTFNANKIIAFLFMNVFICDFVKKYQNNILKDPNFLDNKGIEWIMGDISSSKLYDFLLDYIRTRRDYTSNFNRNGKIMYDESRIPASYYMDFTIKNKKQVKDTKEVLKDLDQLDNTYYNLQPIPRGKSQAKVYSDELKQIIKDDWGSTENPYNKAEEAEPSNGLYHQIRQNKYNTYSYYGNDPFISNKLTDDTWKPTIKKAEKKENNNTEENLPW